ncbi:GNAT family N-acetyltransferase [Nocardia nova]|uniref:GNAT family N-acetyltransferase n=1 Tax=Nocardia nova TaxID=37330 RepID=UPI0033ED8F28
MAVIVERAIGVAEYRRLRAEVGWSSPDERVCAAALAASLFAVVADDGQGHSVGMARVVGDRIYAIVVDVVVAPRAQGRGIGAMLIAAVVQWAGAQGVPHLALGAADELAGMYHRRGFGRAGQYLRLTGSLPSQ